MSSPLADADVCETDPTDDVRRVGRPRSEERHHAILDAARDALIDEGYGAMSIERIAARVGAGKNTVYRRWRNKAELVVDTISHYACHAVPLVDTGDLREDMRTYLRGLYESFTGIDGKLMTAFAVERIRHPELQAEFDRVFIAGRREYLRGIVRAAVERGELPADTDVEILADVGPALLWQQLTMRPGPMADDLPDRIVEQFFPPSRRRGAGRRPR